MANTSLLLSLSCAVCLFGSDLLHAEEPMVCRGSITSKQGAGLVVRTFRFEVDGISGRNVDEVLESCRRIAQEKQNRAARANPGVPFRPFSEVDLQCSQGGEKLQVKRTLRTGQKE